MSKRSRQTSWFMDVYGKSVSCKSIVLGCFRNFAVLKIEG